MRLKLYQKSIFCSIADRGISLLHCAGKKSSVTVTLICNPACPTSLNSCNFAFLIHEFNLMMLGKRKKNVRGDFAMFAFEFHRKVGQHLFSSPRPRGQPKICQSLNAA